MDEQLQSAVLRSAADRVRALARCTTPGLWEAGERCVWAGGATVVSDGPEGDGGARNPADAAWIALMSPSTAEAFAVMLTDAARMFALYEGRGWTRERIATMVKSSDLAALSIARAIESTPVFNKSGE